MGVGVLGDLASSSLPMETDSEGGSATGPQLHTKHPACIWLVSFPQVFNLHLISALFLHCVMVTLTPPLPVYVCVRARMCVHSEEIFIVGPTPPHTPSTLFEKGSHRHVQQATWPMN